MGTDSPEGPHYVSSAYFFGDQKFRRLEKMKCVPTPGSHLVVLYNPNWRVGNDIPMSLLITLARCFFSRYKALFIFSFLWNVLRVAQVGNFKNLLSGVCLFVCLPVFLSKLFLEHVVRYLSTFLFVFLWTFSFHKIFPKNHLANINHTRHKILMGGGNSRSHKFYSKSVLISCLMFRRNS